MKTEEEINELNTQHNEAPHLRILQNALAEDITVTVHSTEALENAKAASQILFGKSTEENVRELSADAFQLIGQEVTLHEINKDLIPNGISIVDLLSENAPIFNSKGEARRALKNNAVAVNKNKVQDSKMITSDDVIKGNYILLQNGKKNYHLIVLQD